MPNPGIVGARQPHTRPGPTGATHEHDYQGAACRAPHRANEPLVRSGLRAILEPEPDLTVVGEADDGAAVVAQARRTRPDVVLMDVRMPHVDGIAATRLLGQFDGGGPAVIVVTTFENDDYGYDALQAGARGFLLKRASADDVFNAIRTVHNGESLLFLAAIRRLASRHDTPGGRGLAEANLIR